jgi:hypothetical protein
LSANKLNNYFVDSVNTITGSMSPRPYNSTDRHNAIANNDDCAFDFDNISKSDVINAIKNLPVSASTSIDEVNSKMLTMSCYSISTVLSQIFNKSTQDNIFPDI